MCCRWANRFVALERDAQALAEAIKRLTTDPTKRIEVDAHSRKPAAEYGWSHLATIFKRPNLRVRASEEHG